MNDQKLKKLFDAAGKMPAPEPPADFAGDVLRAVRRASPAPGTHGYSIFDQLNLLFPRVALAALAVILVSAAIEFADNSSTTDEAGVSNMAPSLDPTEDL